MAEIYYDRDADLEVLEQKTIAILGYGNQGRSQALNIRDTGAGEVLIGNRDDDYRKRAERDGFTVHSIAEAAERGDILFMLLPDEVAPTIYRGQVEPGLGEGDVLNFASGYNITFGAIVPPSGVDVIMVAPRMIGESVRSLYVNGKGFPSFVAVEQDASGRAHELALALARAIGSTKKGAIEVTFRDETYLDLMAEHVTWPLIIGLLEEVFRFQVEMGHPEEAVLMELYLSREPAEVLEKAAELGLYRQLPLHSHTSQYGQLTRLEEFDRGVFREFIAQQYRGIRAGHFAREWQNEQQSGLPVLKNRLEAALNSELSRAEERIRDRLRDPE